MTYTCRCPHCGTIVRGGHGTPIKRIDTPIRTCQHCCRNYVDSNMYEWAILDNIHKFHFFFFANNRWIMYFFLSIFAAGGYRILALAGAITWVFVCYAWVKITKKKNIEDSCERCLQPGYIDVLLKVYNKIDKKKINQYKEKIEKREKAKSQSEQKIEGE